MEAAVRVKKAHQWDPECWKWPVPDLSHLHGKEPLAVEKKAEKTLKKWQAGRCAMCGNIESLLTDHDHKTGLIRGLLCRSCNITEGVQHGADMPLERYRNRSPAMILGITVRYFDHFHGRYAEPEEEQDIEEFLRRAAKFVNEL
jgi:hypothetical protein